MKKFLSKLGLFLLPLFILGIVALFFYVKTDVYGDFTKKDNFAWNYNFQQLNDISTKKLLSTHRPYNSFVLGSSRSCSIYGCYLQTKLPDARFFHYANWNETIGGILAKLQYLDASGYQIDNIMVYLDTDYTFNEDGKLSSMDHYLITKELKAKYFYNHLIAFLSNFDLDKFKILLGKGEQTNSYVNRKLDPITNDFNHVCSAEEIRKYQYIQSDEEFKHRMDSLKKSGFLYERPKEQQYKSPQISEDEEVMIEQIVAILEKHHSKYYVVLTPLYDQQKLSNKDFNILKKHFKNHLYDFSGKNKYTDDFYNYPDRIHFQNYISKQIIDSVVVR